MLLPPEYSRITLTTLYPNYLKGLTVVPFDEGSDGGGDEYLLYWPVGWEQREPFVCLIKHEEALLTVPYRSLASFLAGYDADETDLDKDNFFFFSFAQGKLRFRKGLLREAIKPLLDCVDEFPDFSDAWGLLATIYQTLGLHSEAAVAVRNALLCAWQFGMPSSQCISVFESIIIPSHLVNDPLFVNRAGLLRASTYQQSYQVDYARLWSIRQQYIDMQDVEAAVRITQNYGYALHTAPSSQQNAMQFSTSEWLADLATTKQKLSA